MKIVISVIGVFVPALAGENDVVEIISIVLAIALATGFSTLSEYRNSSRSEALQEEYNKTYAKVMRNGKLVNILTSEIVKEIRSLFRLVIRCRPMVCYLKDI